MEEANWSREYDPEETLLAYESFGDKKINQLTEFELSLILKCYGVRHVKGTRDRLVSILMRLLEVTQLCDQFEEEIKITENSEAKEITQIVTPLWLKLCRSKGIVEEEIKVIIQKLVKTEQGFKELTEGDIEEISLAKETKKLLLEILYANYGIKRGNWKGKVKSTHYQANPEEPARTNPNLIQLKDLAKGDDPYNWLDYATHYLATLNISDHDRLNVLRRHISSKLTMWDRQLEKKGVSLIQKGNRKNKEEIRRIEEKF